MSVQTIKASRVASTFLGILDRDLTLPALVHRGTEVDFTGALGDTVTERVPAYFQARSRTLRGAQTKTPSTLVETPVPITLTDNLYGRIPITSEVLTLDVEAFDRQVTLPVASGIVRGLEDLVVAAMDGAPFEQRVDLNTDDPYRTLVNVRRRLNDARVPFDGRILGIGTGLEEHILNAPQLSQPFGPGETAFREGFIGRIAGFDVYVVQGFDPEVGVAFHRTAFPLVTVAPFVPAGAPWGATASYEGMSVRVVRVIDSDTVTDNFHADIYAGVGVTRDYGAFNQAGQFVPDDAPDLDNDTPLLVRAVLLGDGVASS